MLAISQLFHSLAIRSERDSLFAIGIFSNPAMLGAVLLKYARTRRRGRALRAA